MAHLQFSDSVHGHHVGEHGSMQGVMVLKLRVQHLAGNRKLTDCYTEGRLEKRDLKAPQRHTWFTKAMRSNSATPLGGFFLLNHHSHHHIIEV